MKTWPANTTPGFYCIVHKQFIASDAELIAHTAAALGQAHVITGARLVPGPLPPLPI